jgi:hypothetical protein
VHASELASYGNDHDASFVRVSINCKFKEFELIIFLIIIIITDEIFVSLP